MHPDESRTSFGFRDVPLQEKQGLVDDVFHSVAPRYDLMNDLMSGGLHRAWKAALVTLINPPKSNRPFALLDVAGGTGDIAFRFLNRVHGQGHATILDMTADMLEAGRRRPEADPRAATRWTARAVFWIQNMIDFLTVRKHELRASPELVTVG